MKKIWFFFIFSAALCAFTGAAYAGININIDGEYVDFDSVEPFAEDGVTFVGAKDFFEAIGCTVRWDDETKTVEAFGGDYSASIGVGADFFHINGVQITADTRAAVVDGSVVIPLKQTAENMGMYADWDAETKTVFLGESGKMTTADFLQTMVYYVSSRVIMENLSQDIDRISDLVNEGIESGNNEKIAENLTELVRVRTDAVSCISDLIESGFCIEYDAELKSFIKNDIDFTTLVLEGYAGGDPVTDEQTEEYNSQRTAHVNRVNTLANGIAINLEGYIDDHAYKGELTDDEQQQIGGFIESIVDANISSYGGIVDEELINTGQYADFAVQMYTYIEAVRDAYSKTEAPDKNSRSMDILVYSLTCLSRYAAAFLDYGEGKINDNVFMNGVLAGACSYVQLQSLVVGDSQNIFESGVFYGENTAV